MGQERHGSDRDERTIFDTIAGTYRFAGETAVHELTVD